MICSDENTDRYNERIIQSGWDLSAFRKHPICLENHSYNLGSIIGIVSKIGISHKKLKATINFFNDTEKGREAIKLAAKKILALSVGFRGISVSRGAEIDDDPEIDDEHKGLGLNAIWKRQELLELSCVAVPASSTSLQSDFSSIRNSFQNQQIEIRSLIEPSRNLKGLFKQINDNFDTTERILKAENRELEKTICYDYSRSGSCSYDAFGGLG